MTGSSSSTQNTTDVDDIGITGDDKEGIQALKSFLMTKFETKDLGKLKYFLGIEVARSEKGIVLSQRKYVLDLLEETGLLGAKPTNSPMDGSQKLTDNEGDLFEDHKRYRRLVGKLNYLTITRPDIAFPVSVVSQFLSSPRVPHWEAVIRILKYLKTAPGKGLLFRDHGHMRLTAYSDADFAVKRSTTGYCVFFGGNLVSWKSKKQVVSRSSAESEYRAMADTCCELEWYKHLLTELGFENLVPMTLWCDNKAAQYIAANSVFHERTKHIERDCHFTREKVEAGTVVTRHVRTDEQVADVLTKPLNVSRISYLCDKLGMVDIYAPA